MVDCSCRLILVAQANELFGRMVSRFHAPLRVNSTADNEGSQNEDGKFLGSPRSQREAGDVPFAREQTKPRTKNCDPVQGRRHNNGRAD